MIVAFVRSSFLSGMDWCAHKAYIEYNLGYKSSTGKKAWMGTVTHAGLETLGMVKLARDAGKKKVKSEIFNHSLKKLEDLDFIVTTCFEYYDKHDPVGAVKADLNTCKKWLHKAVAFNNGIMDPRNQNIFTTELFFDIELKQDWAKYEYTIGKDILKGQIRLKGTIDVLSKEGDNYYQLLDYKTGQRKNWATGKLKTFEDFQKDPQLLLYYYALRNMYPEASFYASIYYVNHGGEKYPDDGGVFSVVFDDTDYALAEEMIRQKVAYIQNIKIPQLHDPTNRDWKCGICSFSERSKDNPSMSVCQFLHEEVVNHGLEQTIVDHGDISKIFDYGAGGGKLEAAR